MTPWLPLDHDGSADATRRALDEIRDHGQLRIALQQLDTETEPIAGTLQREDGELTQSAVGSS